jgi:hypothetical protein
MQKFLLIVLFISCTKEYSRETNVNAQTNYDTTLTGSGNNTWILKIPDSLVGRESTIKFYVTLYSTKTDSIGRNDYISELLMNHIVKKYSGNPVLKNQLTLNGNIFLPDTLKYYTTTFWYGSYLQHLTFRDTIKITITQN